MNVIYLFDIIFPDNLSFRETLECFFNNIPNTTEISITTENSVNLDLPIAPPFLDTAPDKWPLAIIIFLSIFIMALIAFCVIKTKRKIGEHFMAAFASPIENTTSASVYQTTHF